jgi:hypothetical protein
VPTFLQLGELCRVAILADLIAEVVLEGRLDGIMAFDTLRIHISSRGPVGMLYTVTGVALIGGGGMVLMAVGAVLPAVRSHVQTKGFIAVTVRTLLIGYLVFPVGGVRIVAVKTGRIIKIVLCAMAICALGRYIDFRFAIRIVACLAGRPRMLSSSN